MLVPFYKWKGDTRDCGAYRGMKLLEHGIKIVERAFERTVREVVDVNNIQCGFMPGRGRLMKVRVEMSYRKRRK